MLREDYRKTVKVSYNNNIFQVFLRKDNKIGFYKILKVDGKEKYEIPTAKEFLHLSSLFYKKSMKF